MKRFSKMTRQEAEFRMKWGTAADRLAKARKSAEEWKLRHPNYHHSYHEWQANRPRPFNHGYYGTGPGVWEIRFPEAKTLEQRQEHDRLRRLPRGHEDRRGLENPGLDQSFYSGNDFQGLRVCGDAHDVARKHGYPRAVEEHGWYQNEYGDTVVGVVIQLPYRALLRLAEASYDNAVRWNRHNGLSLEQWMKPYKVRPTHFAEDAKGCYLPAYRYSDADGTIIFFRDWEDSPVEAAKSANEYARLAAEQAREDNAQERAYNDISDAKQTLQSLREDTRKLVREMREAKELGVLYPTICDTLRGKLTEMRGEMHEAWNTIRAREDDFWTAVNPQ